MNPPRVSDPNPRLLLQQIAVLTADLKIALSNFATLQLQFEELARRHSRLKQLRPPTDRPHNPPAT